jgi:hypothetical protein
MRRGATPLTTVSSKNKFWYQYTFTNEKSQIEGRPAASMENDFENPVNIVADYPSFS